MKKFTLTFITLLIVSLAFAQTADKKWGLGLEGGVYGNIDNKGVGFMPGIYLSRYVSPSLDVFIREELGLFNSKVMNNLDLGALSLNLKYKLAKESKVLPYLYGGLGYLNDNEDAGVNFNAGLGSKFAISPGTSLFLEGGYISGIETVLNGKTLNDDFWKLAGGIEFSFGKAKDSDGDGVSDRKDECPGTPAGVKVDEKGCPLDRDGDGVPDYKDDCPDEPGGAALNGCPDKDGDGIADYKDDCPDTPGLKKYKGCPDTDGDGVPDPKDKCPDTPKGCPVDVDGCPLDSDGDGVIDCQDDCPTEAGLLDNKGCPANWEEITLGPVYFDFDKSVLKPDAIAILDKAVEKLNSSAAYDVTVSGYTCNIGTEEYNQKLSERRAKAVVVYLAKKGIDNAFVGAKGYGESNPAVPNTSIENRRKNRRAEFEIKIKRRR
ncbi:MAG: OmpA family protein [Chlorobi bacterium]|nr:OmpA family protein [Chlorobiota bacterium]